MIFIISLSEIKSYFINNAFQVLDKISGKLYNKYIKKASLFYKFNFERNDFQWV